MFLTIIGASLVALGLFAGIVLVVAPFGVMPWTAGPVLWALFPLLSIVGYALFVVGARDPHVRWLSIAASGLMLLLAVASAAGLVMEAASVIRPESSTLSLWYVLAVAGVLGALGGASFRNTKAAA